MTKTEIRNLKVGDKYLAITPLGRHCIRTIKFITKMGYKPYIVFYGTGYHQRNSYDDLLHDSYTLISKKKKHNND